MPRGHGHDEGCEAEAKRLAPNCWILTLHLKDRKKNDGPNMPFGEGAPPIVAVLQLLRDNKWRIPANIEYEYAKKGMDTIEEVKKGLEYCNKALES